MKKANVLVVEDDYINSLILMKILEDRFNCSLSVNAKEVLEKIEKDMFDVILMDINLGADSMDGEALMKIIKGDKRFKDIKIFAVTSYAMHGDKERFLKAGFDQYHPKPIRREEIISAIEDALN
jgi:two-component system, cell cycle response regulator DivK